MIATKFTYWTSRSGEDRYLTAHGPKGARTYITLQGEAVRQAQAMEVARPLVNALELAHATLRNVLLHHGKDMEPADLHARKLTLAALEVVLADGRAVV